MILLIITLVLLILSVARVFLYRKHIVNDDDFGVVIFSLTFASLIMFVVCVCHGYISTPNMDAKHEIEILLTKDFNASSVIMAGDYNKQIDMYNNYWCRFTVEDRSGYYIDIDSFINMGACE